RLRPVARQDAVEEDDVTGQLGKSIPLRVERTLGGRDQQAEHEGGQGPDQAHPQLHKVLGFRAQMMLGKHGAQNHSEDDASENACQDDAANSQGTHEPSPVTLHGFNRASERPRGGRSPGTVLYWPPWALIISSICFFTASRLNEAGSCIGG